MVEVACHSTLSIQHLLSHSLTHIYADDKDYRTVSLDFYYLMG